MGTGLSKTTNMAHDTAKKQAVKVGTGPFNKSFTNHKGTAKSGGMTSDKPGGKLSPKQLNGTGKGK
jgi:hypothetical protein